VFTRIRVTVMFGIEQDSLRAKQMAIRSHAAARVPLAQLMRVEHH